MQPLLSQLNSADILTHYLVMIHFNTIISSLQMSPFRFIYNWINEHFVMQFSSCSSCFLIIRYKYFPQQLILKHFQSMFLPLKDQVSHSYITTGKIIILYVVINTLLDQRQEDKEAVNWKVASVRHIWQITDWHNHKFKLFFMLLSNRYNFYSSLKTERFSQ